MQYSRHGSRQQFGHNAHQTSVDSYVYFQVRVSICLGAGARRRMVARHRRLRGRRRVRSHCRFAPPLIHFTPYSLTYSVPLFLKRQCDRTPGLLHEVREHLAAAHPRRHEGAPAAQGRRAREQQIVGSGGSPEPPGPLPTHLHTVYMEYSDSLPTPLNPLAERTCFSQAQSRTATRSGPRSSCAATRPGRRAATWPPTTWSTRCRPS